MKKEEILKGLDKLGIKYKKGELKIKLEGRLKRALKKAEKAAIEEPILSKEPVEEPVAEKPAAPLKAEPRKYLYYGGSKLPVWKVEDLPSGEKKLYFLDGSQEVLPIGVYKARIFDEP